MKKQTFKDCNADFLVQLLQAAEGHSRSVLVVLIDIREFSKFSKSVDSVEVAWFVKRAYTWILTQHFPHASFCKPTGDGLLLIIDYSELNLNTVVSTAVNSALRVVSDFPSAFENDDIVTFGVPPNIAVAITRGTACEIRSKNRTVDYSGKLLNLASRLLALCRPKGVVLEGNFQPLLDHSLQDRFQDQLVYLRGISESQGVKILTTTDVVIPSEALTPLVDNEWASIEAIETTLREMESRGHFHIDLPSDYLAKSACLIRVWFPSRRGNRINKHFTSFEEDRVVPKLSAGFWELVIDFPRYTERLTRRGAKVKDRVVIEILYERSISSQEETKPVTEE